MKRTIQDINYLEETEELAKYAKALGHPTRIKILNYLENQSCCYTGDFLNNLKFLFELDDLELLHILLILQFLLNS